MNSGAWLSAISQRTPLRRDVSILLAAITIAVAVSTTVGMFTSRLQNAIRRESATVLAADLRLESGRGLESLDLPERRAREFSLETARTISFTSVIHAGDLGQLATVIATDGGYPLRGDLRLSSEAYGPSKPTRTLPTPGSAYLDPRLASRLSVRIGDEIRVGAAHLRITAILSDRPDRGSTMAEIAPAILISTADLSGSGLLNHASRATYALLVAGSPVKVDRYTLWLQAHKAPAEKLVTVAQSSAQLGAAADRAGQFLHLAAITTVLLAAIALAMASRRYAARRRDEVALLKCLGATRKMILVRYSREALAMSTVGGAIGVMLGTVAQLGLAQLAQVFTASAALPAPGITPVFLGFLTSFIMMAGFGLPPIVELARISPMRIFREGIAPRAMPLIVPAVCAVATLLAILFLYVHDMRLVLGTGLALGLATGVYAGISVTLLRLIRLMRSNASQAWRYGAVALARRARESTAQLMAFGLGLTILLLLGVVRKDLINEWQRTLPADAPNHFLINVAPGERQSVAEFFTSQDAAVDFAPWVRARLQSINGTPVSARMPRTERGRAFAEREQNLTFSANVPPDNDIVEGQWWPTSGPVSPTVSVATEFRDELGLKLGDQLIFDVAGESIQAVVGSVRRVRWDGFRPNFFIVFSPGLLDDNVGSYLAAVHLDARSKRSLAEFDRRFPTITVIDVEGLLSAIRSLLDRAAAAITYVFAFTLLASLIVLVAGVSATADERRYEGALLRSLGASRRQVLLGVWAEFLVLGVLAGLIAASLAAAIGLFLARYWLHLPWRPLGSLWIWGLAGGGIGVGIAGVVSAWRVALAPPSQVLRNLDV